ncbi:MAG: hypothetical protein J07AB43_00520, partial [Candidatus Nanosalina sp. J07AB43]
LVRDSEIVSIKRGEVNE